MDIGRGRRREYPNQHFVLLLIQKRGHAQNILPDSGSSGDVTSDQNCATTLVRKNNAVEKAGHAQNILPVM